MNIQELANKLAKIDKIETWKVHTKGIDPSVRVKAYKIAEPAWVKRMLDTGKLLVHPDVAEQLRVQKYEPNDIQKRMIWASVIATDESQESKDRFYLIKAKLIRRYGRNWWEDVYQRKNSVFAARERMRRTFSGPIFSVFLTRTHVGKECAKNEQKKALSMIPKGEL